MIGKLLILTASVLALSKAIACVDFPDGTQKGTNSSCYPIPDDWKPRPFPDDRGPIALRTSAKPVPDPLIEYVAYNGQDGQNGKGYEDGANGGNGGSGSHPGNGGNGGNAEYGHGGDGGDGGDAI